ncbi:transcription factor Sox-19a-like isoform X1 [Xyrichtys novacula]|uniref:Sex-determining region Y protein n=1 Tax=Xyrichtys novacula TaxID=13765 RepID=A0AAV1FS48_XYRNO|nr:transcription factor Sox-19a-like isoform X1 [Xyrichtys novacula]
MDGLAEKSCPGRGLRGPDPQMAASDLSHNACSDQFQPSVGVGDGVRTFENRSTSAATHDKLEDGKPSSSSTSLHQPVLHRHMSEELRGDGGGEMGGVRTDTPPFGSQQAGVAVEIPLQCTEYGDAVKLKPAYFTADPSASLEGGGGKVDPVTSSSTIQPPKKAVFQLQPYQSKNGHIKRPMNAYMVWSRIRRCIVKEQNPGVRVTSAELGHEWSKLSEEEKRPYFEIANKQKQMHQQRFPDYEYCPQSKKRLLASEQRVGHDVDLSAFRRVIPSCSEFQDPNRDARRSTIPHSAGFCFCQSYQYIPMDFCPSVKIHFASRIFNRYPNTYSTMKKERDHSYNHPERKESDLAPLYDTEQQDDCEANNSHEVMLDSTTTPDSLELTDNSISQQLSSNDTMNSSSDEYVDVVGLP